jgi:Mn-containing catalase
MSQKGASGNLISGTESETFQGCFNDSIIENNVATEEAFHLEVISSLIERR